MFHLVVTLCEGEMTPRMVITLNKYPILTIASHNTFKVNKMKIHYCQVLRTSDTLNHYKVGVVPNVIVMHNEKWVFQLEGVLVEWYRP
jgi:hypothetical protein